MGYLFLYLNKFLVGSYLCHKTKTNSSRKFLSLYIYLPVVKMRASKRKRAERLRTTLYFRSRSKPTGFCRVQIFRIGRFALKGEVTYSFYSIRLVTSFYWINNELQFGNLAWLLKLRCEACLQSIPALNMKLINAVPRSECQVCGWLIQRFRS